jgi:toxin ParE1/3/4
MAARKISWSPEAEQDLLEIWQYRAEHGSVEAADRLLRAIDTACRSLADGPFRGRARDELRPGLRSILVEAYLIFYRVGAGAVEVVGVLHERRDAGAMFDH